MGKPSFDSGRAGNGSAFSLHCALIGFSETVTCHFPETIVENAPYHPLKIGTLAQGRALDSALLPLEVRRSFHVKQLIWESTGMRKSVTGIGFALCLGGVLSLALIN